MNNLLIQEITDDDREKYYEAQIQRDLSLPFHPQIHFRMLMNLNSVHKKYLVLKNLIWEKFYGSREETDRKNILTEDS